VPPPPPPAAPELPAPSPAPAPSPSPEGAAAGGAAGSALLLPRAAGQVPGLADVVDKVELVTFFRDHEWGVRFVDGRIVYAVRPDSGIDLADASWSPGLGDLITAGRPDAPVFSVEWSAQGISLDDPSERALLEHLDAFIVERTLTFADGDTSGSVQVDKDGTRGKRRRTAGTRQGG
jgi:hypothetical protein